MIKVTLASEKKLTIHATILWREIIPVDITIMKRTTKYRLSKSNMYKIAYSYDITQLLFQ